MGSCSFFVVIPRQPRRRAALLLSGTVPLLDSHRATNQGGLVACTTVTTCTVSTTSKPIILFSA
eukprot:4044042-Pyramimonas_sp.AAC.2